MRAYTVATVAVALRVSPKWVDNILSHHKIRGVAQSRQGIARRLTVEAATVLELALRLSRTFGIPILRALEMAQSLLAADARTSLDGDGCTLTVDVEGVREYVAVRLADAVEYSPVPRRGRPPARQ